MGFLDELGGNVATGSVTLQSPLLHSTSGLFSLLDPMCLRVQVLASETYKLTLI